MEKNIDQLIEKTQKHIENTVKRFNFRGCFGNKPYKHIKDMLAHDYATSVIDAILDNAQSDDDVERYCRGYLEVGGNGWEEGAEDYIWCEIEDELKKNA